MGTAITRTKIVRPQPIDAYLLRLNAFSTPSIAQYPDADNLSSDPFYRLFFWGNLRYKKLNAASTQEFQVQIRGANTTVNLFSRFFNTTDVTPTALQGEEWQSDIERISRPSIIPARILPPGMSIAVTCEKNSGTSDILMDLLMFESLDPEELKRLI